MVVVSSGNVEDGLCMFPVTIFTTRHGGNVAVKTQCSHTRAADSDYCFYHLKETVRYTPIAVTAAGDDNEAIIQAVAHYRERFKMSISVFTKWATHLVKSRDEYIRQAMSRPIDIVTEMNID